MAPFGLNDFNSALSLNYQSIHQMQMYGIFPGYLDLLSIKLRFTNDGMQPKLKEAIELVFFQSMVLMQGENVLENLDRLSDFDKYHIQLYEANPFWFNYIPPEEILNDTYVNQIYGVTIHNMNYFNYNAHNVQNIPYYKLKVSTKFALILSNWEVIPTVPVEDIFHAYKNLMTGQSQLLIKDSCILKEWNKFIVTNAMKIAELLSDDVCGQLTEYFWKSNMNLAASYIFYTQIANLLKRQNKPSQKINDLLKIIAHLQELIGEANTEEIFVQKLVAREKQTFYGLRGDQISPYVKNVFLFARQQIELFKNLNVGFNTLFKSNLPVTEDEADRVGILKATYRCLNRKDLSFDPTEICSPTNKMYIDQLRQITKGFKERCIQSKLLFDDPFIADIFQFEKGMAAVNNCSLGNNTQNLKTPSAKRNKNHSRRPEYTFQRKGVVAF